LDAQITIVENDFPSSNDTIRFSVTTNVIGDYTTSGNNVLWDFSGLIPDSQYVKKYNPIFELDIPVLPGYSANKSLGLLYYFNDDQSKVTLYKAGTHNATVTFDTTKNATFTLTQDGQQIIQNINKGSTTTISITQN
jgi:hypothetical protein